MAGLGAAWGLVSLVRPATPTPKPPLTHKDRMRLILAPLSIRTVGSAGRWAGAFTTTVDIDTDILKRYGRTHRTKRLNRSDT